MLYILLSFSLSSGIRPPFFIHNRSSLPPNFIPSYPVLSDRTSLHLIDYDLPIVKPFFQVFFYDNFRPVFRKNLFDQIRPFDQRNTVAHKMCIRDRLRFAQLGFPIQKSPDRWVFAPPRSFSQLITSFIGS